MLNHAQVNAMTKLIGTLVMSGALALLPAVARPQDDEWETSPQSGPVERGPVETQAPSTRPPADLPPIPPAETPAPPQAQAETPSQQLPAGQWVYTQQYGWIWMPYSDSYTYSPPSGSGEPYAYVYYPAYGWAWIAAPWMWGFGAWPFFGVYGPARYGWYAHGWWRHPAQWHYAPMRGARYGIRPAPVYRGGAGQPGVRPAPVRGSGGSGGSAPRPAPRHTTSAFVGGGHVGGAPHGGFAARGGPAFTGGRSGGPGGAGMFSGFAAHGGSVGGSHGGGHGGGGHVGRGRG